MKDKDQNLIYEAYLNESVTVSVKDHHDNRPETVLDVIHLLWRKVEMSRWWKEGGRDWIKPETLAPDGNDALKAAGTINVYTGLSDLGKDNQLSYEFVTDLVGWIEEIDGVDAQVTGHEEPETSKSTGSNVHRIVVVVDDSNREGRAPEMQMSNRNAYEILHNVLDIVYRDGWYEDIDARDIIFRIDALVDDIDIRAGTVEPRDEKETGKARIIDPGLNEDNIRQRLEYIKRIAEWALANNYTKLQAG